MMTCTLFARRHACFAGRTQSASQAGRRAAADGASSAAVASTSSELPFPPELRAYRPNVGVCVFNDQGLVFGAVRTNDALGSWQMPQGGIDRGENAAKAAVRELYEETSIRSVTLVSSIDRWLPYDFPTSVRCQLSGGWADYHGQAQRWYLLRFTGDDSEINLDTAHKEFTRWQWMPLDDLPRSVVDFKRGVYEQVAAEFGPRIRQELQQQLQHTS